LLLLLLLLCLQVLTDITLYLLLIQRVLLTATLKRLRNAV
jgi:hypothetical protein